MIGTTGESLLRAGVQAALLGQTQETAALGRAARATRSGSSSSRRIAAKAAAAFERANAHAEHKARRRVLQVLDHGAAAGDVAAATSEAPC